VIVHGPWATRYRLSAGLSIAGPEFNPRGIFNRQPSAMSFDDDGLASEYTGKSIEPVGPLHCSVSMLNLSTAISLDWQAHGEQRGSREPFVVR